MGNLLEHLGLCFLLLFSIPICLSVDVGSHFLVIALDRQVNYWLLLLYVENKSLHLVSSD